MNPFYLSLTIVSILLIGAVMLQNQSGGGWASMAGSTTSYHTKRGVEKVLFYATIVLAVLFASLTLLSLIYS